MQVGQAAWESERKTFISRIDVLESNKRTMTAILDNAGIQSTEKQEQLDAAKRNVAQQDGKRNLLEAEVASLQVEVARLSAVTAPAGRYTDEQLQQAIESTVHKDKEHFDEQLAEQSVRLENEHRVLIRDCDDRIVRWMESAQEWKERSEGQAIDIVWWEEFGRAFPDQLVNYEQQVGEPI